MTDEQRDGCERPEGERGGPFTHELQGGWFRVPLAPLAGVSTGLSVGETALGEASAAAPAIAAGHLVVGTGAAPYIPGEHLVCLGPELS